MYLLGAFIGAAVSASIIAFIVQFATKISAKFKPTYLMAYRAAFFASMVPALIFIPSDLIFKTSNENTLMLIYISQLIIIYFLQSLVYGKFIWASGGYEIGIKNGLIINLFHVIFGLLLFLTIYFILISFFIK